MASLVCLSRMHLSSLFEIRNVVPEDAHDIQSIQMACYRPELQESSTVLLAKSTLSPASCWLVSDKDGAVGYLFSHPWRGILPPALNQPLQVLPEQADTLFLHDLAIHPRVRGIGISGALLDRARNWALSHQLQHALLVAVEQSHAFWQRHGFDQEIAGGNELHAKLAAYGPQACCLRLSLHDWRATSDANC